MVTSHSFNSLRSTTLFGCCSRFLRTYACHVHALQCLPLNYVKEQANDKRLHKSTMATCTMQSLPQQHVAVVELKLLYL